MSNFTGTVPTILAGDIVTGDDWDAVLDELLALDDAWISFGVEWSSSGTAPVVGDGTLTATYKQVGKTVKYFVKLIWGSTTTGGTGRWKFTAPGAPAFTDYAISGICFDSSATVGYPCSTLWTASSPYIDLIAAHTTAGVAGVVGATHPFTWTTSDRITLMGTYEVS